MRISRSRPSFGTGVERGGRVRRTALALCAITGLAGTPAAGQLLVDPLEVMLTTEGANSIAATFTIMNSSARAVQATITREDWDRLENGENRFLPPGTTGASCGKLLSVSPLTIRVEPRSSRTVRLAVEGAEALKKECWDIVFVEEAPQRQSVRGNSLQYTFRTGVKVYVAPPGLPLDAAIEDMKIEDVAVHPDSAKANKPVAGKAAGTKRQIAIRFRNTGGMHLLAKGRLEFRRPDNSLAIQVPIPEFPTLPGSTRKVSIDAPTALVAGEYVVLALIDFGGAELIAGQIDYQAK
jgi:P pilus assembly chaperone PapD